jgi:fluoroacetyl-CoA thioesterase
MKTTLQPGMEFTHRFVVPENKTVPYVFPESEKFQAMPKVFATAFMVGLMEWACMEALAPYLEDDECTLGVRIDVTHSAATPPGMEVSVDVKLTEVSGQRTSWQIVARDEVEVIGGGTHDRFTVSAERFTRSVEKKATRK